MIRNNRSLAWPLPLLLGSLLAACPAEQPAEPQRPDPSLSALTRLVERENQPRSPDPALPDCLARARRETTCTLLPGARTFPLRLFLDPRYPEHWPGWQERLATTLACVNQLYRGSGISWSFQSVQRWDPGQDRHNLRALLRRLQLEHPADLRSVVVGISLWEPRRIYASAGGEIGLSQRAACVVPSWPRLENDCLTLAHELAHIVGARHVPGREHIMAWAGHLFHLPARDAVSRVVATHRFHPRNLEALRIYQRASFTPDGLALPDQCAVRLDAIDRCWKL